MLANTRVQYAFRILDVADVPDRKAKPKRLMIVALTVLSAGFIFVIILFIREGVVKRRVAQIDS